MGHVDFYPNGGKDQPGCSLLDVPVSIHSVTDPDKTADTVGRHLVACSHTRAIELYIESLDAHTAGSCVNVGFECSSYDEFNLVNTTNYLNAIQNSRDIINIRIFETQTTVACKVHSLKIMSKQFLFKVMKC